MEKRKKVTYEFFKNISPNFDDLKNKLQQNNLKDFHFRYGYCNEEFCFDMYFIFETFELNFSGVLSDKGPIDRDLFLEDKSKFICIYNEYGDCEDVIYEDMNLKELWILLLDLNYDWIIKNMKL